TLSRLPRLSAVMGGARRRRHRNRHRTGIRRHAGTARGTPRSGAGVVETIVMLVADSSRYALQAITAHRLRSVLTLLGIAVGIAAVILLTSIGEGVHRFVLEVSRITADRG